MLGQRVGQRAAIRRPGRALRLLPVAALKAKGRRYGASQLSVQRPLGEGSYGQVFEVGGPGELLEGLAALRSQLARRQHGPATPIHHAGAAGDRRH